MLTGVAEYTTAQACRWAAEAAKLGADGLMVLPPMVYKTDDRETIAHFRTVAKATDLPIMVYNNPPAYKVDITPEMFVEMADEPKFACIKESSDNPRRITDIINLTKDRYVLFAGVDDLFLECMMLGAVGWVSGLVNAFPHENRMIWDLAAAGKWKEALDIYRWYTPRVAPRHAHQAGAVHQARRRRVRLRHRTVPPAAAAARRRGTRTGAEDHPHRHRHSTREEVNPIHRRERGGRRDQ